MGVDQMGIDQMGVDQMGTHPVIIKLQSVNHTLRKTQTSCCSWWGGERGGRGEQARGGERGGRGEQAREGRKRRTGQVRRGIGRGEQAR